MEKKMLSVKNDLIFKKVFGSQSSKDILIGFLKSVLDIPHDDYDYITITDPNLRIDGEDDKYGILDLKLKTKSGRIINIELQLWQIHEMPHRTMFYSGKSFTEQIETGEEYSVIKKVIHILILDYNMFKDKAKYNHKFLMHDPADDTYFSDLYEIRTLELKKLPKEWDNTEIYYWLSLFNAVEREEFNMLKEKSPELEKAVLVLEELSEDEQTRLLAEAHEKQRRDINARIRTAELNGIELGKVEGIEIGKVEGIELGKVEGIEIGKVEGIELGKVEEKIEIAKKLIEIQMNIDEISKITGLTKNEIEKLMI